MVRVLVIDEPTPIRRLAIHLFEEQGWVAEPILCPQQALLRLAEQSFDVVCCEARCAAEGDFRFLGSVRKLFPQLPVAVLVAEVERELAQAAIAHGASLCIWKHSLEQTLASEIRNLLMIPREARPVADVRERSCRLSFTLSLDHDRTQIPVVIRNLLDEAAAMGVMQEDDRSRLGIAIEEALVNAIVHGNLEVSSELKEQDDSAFERLIAIRQAHPKYSRRRVRVSVDVTPVELCIKVCDEGPGFDVASIPDPTDPANIGRPSGRGILLMRAFLDVVTFNAQGNEVTLVLRALPSVTAQRDTVR